MTHNHKDPFFNPTSDTDLESEIRNQVYALMQEKSMPCQKEKQSWLSRNKGVLVGILSPLVVIGTFFLTGAIDIALSKDNVGEAKAAQVEMKKEIKEEQAEQNSKIRDTELAVKGLQTTQQEIKEDLGELKEGIKEVDRKLERLLQRPE